MSRPFSSFPLALTVSVLVNLLLAGLVIGYLAGKGPDRGEDRRGDRPPPGPMSSEYALARGIVDLGPAEDRRAVIGMFRSVVVDNGEGLRRRVEARNALGAAIVQEPYDPEAVRQAMNDLQAVDRELQVAFQEAIVTRLAELTPDQRRQLGAMMTRDRFRRERFGDRRRDGAPPAQEE